MEEDKLSTEFQSKDALAEGESLAETEEPAHLEPESSVQSVALTTVEDSTPVMEAKVAPEEIPNWLNDTAPTPIIKVMMGANIAIFIGMTASAFIQANAASSGNYSFQSLVEVLIALPTDTLVNWGANSAGVTVLDHQYWRLITNTFLHTNLIHLGMNMYVLWDFNRLLERLYGSSKFLVIYLLSGLGSSICSLLFLDPSSVSAGASGAIFGIFGATVAFFWAFRKDFPKKFFRMYQKMFFMFLIYCVISSQMFPGMDNAAHLGGFIVGLWTALCLLPSSPASKKWAKGNFLKLACLTLVLVIGLELDIRMSRNNPKVIGELQYSQAVKLLKADKFDEAIIQLKKAAQTTPSNAAIYADEALAYGKLKRFQEAVDAATIALKIDPKDKKTLAARGAAYRNLKEDQLAINDYDHLIKINPRSALAYNNRGWTYLAEGKPYLAIADSTRAIEVDGQNAAAYDTRGLALAMSGKDDQALSDFARYIKLKPKDGSVYYHRAYMYFKAGKIDEAKQDLNVARKSDYQLEDWESLLFQDTLKL